MNCSYVLHYQFALLIILFQQCVEEKLKVAELYPEDRPGALCEILEVFEVNVSIFIRDKNYC